MVNILSICPTRGRLPQLKKMVESFYKTAELDNTLVLGVNIDDPELMGYDQFPCEKVICKAGATVTEIINDIYKRYPNYKFYQLLNDDLIIHTKGWDRKFYSIWDVYGEGVFYGNDLFQGENLPTFPFVSSKVTKALGYLQLPSLNRYYGDMVWQHIGKEANCLYYLDGVIFEHKHFLAGKQKEDTTNKEIYLHDKLAWASWLRDSHLDIQKVKEIV